jgi:hypothetical protein
MLATVETEILEMLLQVVLQLAPGLARAPGARLQTPQPGQLEREPKPGERVRVPEVHEPAREREATTT